MRLVAFVNRQGGEERRNEMAGAGELIDFDPTDPTIVKVHYDLSAWTFDQRAELSEALAESETPHSWDGEELVVPEVVEGAVDAIFEELERDLGPFPVALEEGAPATEFGLDEWTTADRELLTASLVDAEVPHRWEGTTIVVAEDAEETVDDLLDSIEHGELLSADDESSNEPPDGVLSTIFLAADKLAKDPFDAKSRTALIDVSRHTDPKHPPYAFAPRTWAQTVRRVDALVRRFDDEAAGRDRDEVDTAEESSDVVGMAQELRASLRDFV